ncbi:MAG: penicillin-binding transpeptidase domain-containing protein, partial [Planctomycetota bacterium]
MQKTSAAQASNLLSFRRGRSVFLLGLVLVSYAGLGGRLVYLQYVNHSWIARHAEEQLEGTRPLPARRGAILDADGREVALSIRGYGCAIDPIESSNLRSTLSALRNALGLRDEELKAALERLSECHASGRISRFLWIRRLVSDEEAESIRRLDLPEVRLVPLETRRYPQGRTACHILGFTNIDGVGQEGLELAWESALSGSPGEERLLRDGRRRVFSVGEHPLKPTVDGLELHLALDGCIQGLVERELAKVWREYKPRRASGLVMDPFTGDILAMANLPDFDGNKAREADPAVRLNPAVAAIFEPGSAFKPFILSAALDSNAVAPETSFHCENGTWNLGFRVLHDV